MNKLYPIAIFLSLLLAASAYLASDTWYLGAGVAVLAIAGSVLYGVPAVRIFLIGERKRHECYLFMHGYLVTLSVTHSLDRAFEVGSQPMGEAFHTLDETLQTMGAQEKTEYLLSYFETDLYRMFLSILRLYLDRGGDVLKLSSELTAESSRVEENAVAYGKMAARKAMSFFFLWLMSLVIVVFLRFGLASFYQTLRHSLVYLICLVGYYAFFLVSVFLYIKAHTGSKVFPFKRKEPKGEQA